MSQINMTVVVMNKVLQTVRTIQCTDLNFHYDPVMI